MKFNWFYVLCAIFVSIPVIAEIDDDAEIEYEIEYEDFEEEPEEYDEGVSEDYDVVDDVENSEPEPVAEQRTVSARMTCAQISEKIADLRQDVTAYPEVQPELEKMVGRFRTQCAQTIQRRPVRNYDNVNPVTEVDVPETLEVIDQTTPVVTEVVVSKPVAQPVAAPAPAPKPLKPEEIAANAAKFNDNLAHGLCGDGTKPNKYGCCAGEVFKEVAQMKFACCMKSNLDDCVEPIKKK